MRIERLGDLGDGPAVLAAVGHAAADRSLPPPAALLGDWFGSQAVIAPSLEIVATDPERAFDVAPGAGGAVGGGWFGYLSYPDPGADGTGPRIPVAAGGWADSVLRRDGDGCWWYESLTGATLPGWVEEALRHPGTAGPHHVEWTPPDRDAHTRGVLDCLAAISAGEVYQACVCTQFTGRLTGDSLDVFVDLAATGRPARAAYLAGAWGAVASLSPELFLRRHGTAVASSPIKGTLPSWAEPSALLASVKDVAENIMIVDLVRNDLGRVAVTGSVTVPELLAVRPAPGVWHLVSTVAASVDIGVSMGELLDAAFPPASVTGTPKTRARQLLRGWESDRRGIYCGTVGLASPAAGCELNVAIRTVEFGPDGSAVLGVGGGITADSDPDREWDECLHKAASIVGAVHSRERSTAS